MSGEVGVRMAENKDPEFIFFHRNTKTTARFRTTIAENDLKIGGTDFLQLKVYRKSHIKMGRKNRESGSSAVTHSKRDITTTEDSLEKHRV